METAFSLDNRILVPANETERLIAVRSLMAWRDIAAPELDALAELGRLIFRAPLVAVTVIDEDWQYIAASSGFEFSGCTRDHSMCTHVVYAGRPLAVSDLAAHPSFRDLPYVSGSPHFRFYAGAPVEPEPGLAVGAFCILDVEPRHLSEAELAMMAHLGSVAGVLLRLQRSNVTLKRDKTTLATAAMTDPLTGFYNRVALTSIVEDMVSAAVADGRDMGAIYMDIDGFKTVNDRHGHLVGDDFLVEAARRIRSVIRGVDLPVRLGGDEFALFFAGPSDARGMELIAQRLVEAFREPFKLHDVAIQASASIGIALAPSHASSRLELSRNADIALYEAKARGKDQYVIFKHKH